MTSGRRSADEHAQRRGRGRDRHALLVEQLPGEHLVAVHRPQRLTGAVEQTDQLLVGQVREVRDFGEHVVDLFDQVTCEAGKRRAQPTDRPRDLESPNRRPRVDAGEERARAGGLLDAEQLQVDGDVAVDVRR